MTLSSVERALGMMRVYLVESSADDDWGDDRAEELAQTIRACLRQETDELRQKAPERNQKLPPDALRCAIRFVHDNLGSKLKWDDMTAPLGLEPFTFARRFKLATETTPHHSAPRSPTKRTIHPLPSRALT